MRFVAMAVAFNLLFCLLLAGEPTRYTMLEDFEDGSVTLSSYSNEDISPNAWTLDQTYTYNSSQYALKLNGNTWKQESVQPLALASGNVLQVAIRNTGTTARIQGIGFSSGAHTMFYSIDGTATLNIEQWVTVYQGAFSLSTWNLYQLPVAADWYAYFDEFPILNSIIYINDLDSGSGSTWFDNLCLLTTEVPIAPQVTVSFNVQGTSRLTDLTRNVTVDFFSTVLDSDSSVFTYHWDFGDSTYSAIANPVHTYTVTDDHPYTVLLKVTDNTDRWGLARCTVNVDTGLSRLPITMNFVGDIMLARDYEAAGGIIPTLGVNAIFQPTKYLLGDAADITDANLEVVLTNQGTPHPTKSVVYRGNPANIAGLQYAGIDIVSVGNNHILDYGYEGLHQMLDSLSAKGILYSGSGANTYEAYTPAFINKNGLNIAFLRSCDRTGQYNNAQPYLQAGYNKPGFALFTPYYLSEQMAAVDSIADLKIVEMHGGSEYSLSPGSGYDRSQPFAGEVEEEDYSFYSDVPHQWDIAIRHYAVDNGADLVLVHHPHILQGLELYHGKLIAHSLGNFVFDLNFPETMPTMILYADAGLDGFSNYRVVPCFIENLIPQRASAKLGVHILDYLAKRSRDLNTYLLVNKDDATATVVTDTTSISFLPSETELQLFLTPLSAGIFGTEPVKLMRNGSISSLDSVYPGTGWQARLGQECLWSGNMEDEGGNLFDLNQTTETFSTAYFHEGLRSLAITASGSIASVPLQAKMKWYDNTKKYTLHAWIKTRNAAGVNLDIQYYNSRTNNTPYSTESLLSTAITGATDWTFYQKEVTIPSSCSYYIIVCKATDGFAYFDEVGLIEWTAWQNATELHYINFPNDYYWLQLKGTDNPKSVRLHYTEKDVVSSAPMRKQEVPANLLSNLTSYPNPFNPEITLAFSLKQDAELELSIYNIKGQKIKTLVKEKRAKGLQNFTWNGRDSHANPVSSGIYFYKITTGNTSEIRKIVLIK
jgi:poly-gamma-glutamate capsule biosynthesis protein CapA/YwtB (metallophosphatase superfamily)